MSDLSSFPLMPFSFSSSFFTTCQQGFRRMAPESQYLLRASVHSAQGKHGLFVGRAEQEDLYYTFFGLILTAVASVPVRICDCQKTLNSIEQAKLDLIHLCSFLRSIRLLKFLSIPAPLRKILLWNSSLSSFSWYRKVCRNLLSRLFSVNASELVLLVSQLAPEAFPQQTPDSPYSRFLVNTLYSDFGIKPNIPDLSVFRLNNNLFSNLKMESNTPETNTKESTITDKDRTNSMASDCVCASAAALFLLSQEDRLPTANALRARQQSDGSFKSVHNAPSGDLLSTAVALFALKRCGLSGKYCPKQFLRQCFRENGLFASVPWEEKGDLEFTVYGLLTMGVLE